MSKPARAETQYGDLTGTIQIDGVQSGLLSELKMYAKVPVGYRPVGFTCYCERPIELINGVGEEDEPVDDDPMVVLLCVDDNVPIVGGENVTVFEFDTDMTWVQLLDRLKRISICVKDQSVAHNELRIVRNS